MIKVRQYKNEDKNLWDDFVDASKNGHFMFKREYMEYHADRFMDCSMMFFDEKDRLIALIPANIQEGIVYSHGGLTFGGLVLTKKTTALLVSEIFREMLIFLKVKAVSRFVYKRIPDFYNPIPSQEDLYALFCNGAKLFRRDISSAINLEEEVLYTKGRRWMINKAQKGEIEVYESEDFSSFWIVLEHVLSNQHAAAPVHTASEIIELKSKFPKNIRLFLAVLDGNILAGTVVYETKSVAHTQYMANSLLGRELGALDLLIDYLIKKIYKDKKYFDFGISTEDEGRVLNTGLISQKEGFGARSLVHDFYEIII